MSVNIDDISLKVNYSSKKAEDGIKKLTGALHNLRNTLKGIDLKSVVQSMNQVNDGSNKTAKSGENISKGMKSAADSVKKVTDEIQKMNSAASKITMEDVMKHIKDNLNMDYFKQQADRIREMQTLSTGTALMPISNIDFAGGKAFEVLEDSLGGYKELSSEPIQDIADSAFDGASKLDLLKMKLALLQQQMQDAISNGDQGKAIQKGLEIDGLKEKIAKLENVSNDTREAIKNLDDAVGDKKPANNLGESFDRAVKSVKNLGSALKNAAKNMGNSVKAFTKSLPVFKNHTNAINKLALSFKRIIFYRAIRKIISEISQGFQEGTKNVALYSKALNGLDSNNANGAMSELATTSLYLKNSIGAAAIPVLNALIPVLNAVADAAIEVINVFNMLFSSLSGKGTFTRAKRYAVDYADSLNKAGGAAKDLKNNLLGIDELNIIGDNNGSGGGGGDALDYSQMFEEASIQLPKWLEELKDLFLKGDFEGLGKGISTKIANALNSIDWNSIRAKSRSIGEKFSAFVKGIFDPDAGLFASIGKSFAQGINTIFEFIDGFVKDRKMWENIGRSFAQGLNSFVDNIDVHLIARTINNTLLGAITMVTSLFKEAKAKDTFYKLGQKIGTLIKEIKWGEILAGVAEIIYDTIGAAIATWNGVFDGNPIAKSIASGIAVAFVGTKVANIVIGAITSVLVSQGAMTAVEASASKLGLAFGAKFAALAALAIGGYTAGNYLYESFIEDSVLDINYWGDKSRENQATKAQEQISQQIAEAQKAWGAALGDVAFEIPAWSGLLKFEGTDVWANDIENIRSELQLLASDLDLVGISFSDTEAVKTYIDTMGGLDERTRSFVFALLDQYDGLSLNTKALLESEYGFSIVADGYSDAEIAAARANAQAGTYIDNLDKTMDKTAKLAGASLGLAQTQAILNSGYNVGGMSLDEYHDKVVDAEKIQSMFDMAIDGSTTAIGFNGEQIEVVSDEYSQFMSTLEDSSLSAYEFSSYMETLSETDLPTVTKSIKEFADIMDDLTTNIPDFDSASQTAFNNLATSLETVDTDMNAIFDNIEERLPTVSTAFTDNIDTVQKKLEEVKNWYDENIAVMFTADYWTETLSEIPTAFETMAKKVCNVIIDNFNAMVEKISAVEMSMTDPDGNTTTSKMFSFTNAPIPAFANGGIVERGQLFLAREAGVEMVGGWGNQTAVANNDQIVAGIQSGVATAVNQTLAPYLSQIATNTGVTANKDFAVKIGDREIARANTRGQRSMGRQLIYSV